MKKPAVLIAVAFGLALASTAADLVIDASVADTNFTDNVALANATRIIKTGRYKATIDYSSENLSSFAGEIEVREGTLAAKYLTNFGSPTKITVSEGATLDLTSEDEKVNNNYVVKVGNIPKAPLFIAGSGVNDNGAVCRMGMGAVNELLGEITLTADAMIRNTVQIGSKAGKINLEGHTLTIDASIDKNVTGSTFYFPGGQFYKDGTTDDPGHVIVRGGIFFPRFAAMKGGSAKNTLTLHDRYSQGGPSRSWLKLRNTTTRIAWTLVVDSETSGAGYLIHDEEEQDSTNEWAGPVVLTSQLSVDARKAGSHLTLSGNVSGGKTIANISPGLLTLKGTNEFGKITSRAGRMVFEGGKTTIVGAPGFDATVGTLTFKDTELAITTSPGAALYANGNKFDDDGNLLSPVEITADNSLVTGCIRDEGTPAHRLYLGNGNDTKEQYGVFRVQNGTVVSNLAVGVGQNGYGALMVSGKSRYYTRIADAGYDTLGLGSGTYGYVSVDDASLTWDSSYITDRNKFAAYLGGRGTAALCVRNGGVMEILGYDEGTVSHIACSAYTGSHFAGYVASGAQLLVPQTFDIGREGAREQAGAAELTLTGAGTLMSVGDFFRVFYTNEDGSFTLNVNDGATLSTPFLYRLDADNSDGCKMNVNLNGGIIKKTQKSHFSYNGTVKRQPTRVTVFEKGVTIDSLTDGDCRMEYSFQSPGEGQRIKAISLPTDEAFAKDVFLGPPLVKITGDGDGATAFADFDDATRTVRSILVTSPGWGYGSNTVVTIASGDGKSTYECAYELEDQPKDGWVGFRKQGAARLNMYGVNTYRGPTEVAEGILGFHHATAPQGGMPQGSGIILRKGTTLTFNDWDTSVTVPFIRGCGTTSFGCYTVTDAIECNAEDLLAGDHLTVNQDLTLEEGAVVRVLNAEKLLALGDTATRYQAAEVKRNLYVLSSTLRLVFVVNGEETTPEGWFVSVRNNRIVIHKQHGMIMFVR